ncbi:hypothetical protein Egran_01832 [Elaphomyces granulatus]|uniref:UBC core domain-containing protein n=1 Tax=Elaphomyces granulatus TaxID=519963 RepID=A0A232M2T9_9EURO|nr:hypothetical protein Egran_01832 [Elaphomyces granulatus]
MPRKDFLEDLEAARRPGRYPRLVDVGTGDEDGALCFAYVIDKLQVLRIDLQAFVSDLSDYPSSHDYFVFTTSENVPSLVTTVLEEIQPLLAGLSLTDFLSSLSDAVENALSPCSPGENKEGDAGSQDDDDYLPATESDWDIASNEGQVPEEDPFDTESRAQIAEVSPQLRHDLRTAKTAGFRVGYWGSLITLSISCRIAKLGISDEAMQAWGLSPQQYLVLLMRYPGRYRSFDQLLDESLGQPSVEMHVALCDSYKPSLASTMHLFFPYEKLHQQPSSPFGMLNPLFIGKPLNALLNERLLKIVKYRYEFGFTWSGAELYINDVQGKSSNSADPDMAKYSVNENRDPSASVYPRSLTSDHMLDPSASAKLSFPLLAMQFTLRHFVGCTEFCLVCHCRMDANFEALKPYVCSKPLCLYQYITLGFGPSLEWEILSQPYVVDLLVSFTYASAKGNRLRDFPTGLGILVPQGVDCVTDFSSSESVRHLQKPFHLNTLAPGTYIAQLDPVKMELLFPDANSKPPLRAGDWVVIVANVNDAHPVANHWHCRVRNADFWSAVQLSAPVVRGLPTGHTFQRSIAPSKSYSVAFVIYDKNFDDLTEAEKRLVIPMLLDTLPDVHAMGAFLTDESSRKPLLSSWNDRISKSALDVLRWIVASNRSCIMQGDSLNPHAVCEDTVSGMENYIQFRFAQGAPDKEQRFVDSVAAATSRLKLKYPTIFAWHGSSLANWHGIVREGLHFNDILHGRAYGHGVYMSTDWGTSSQYMSQYMGSAGYGGVRSWPNSKLKITGAISLNEVVNAPSEFVSKSPHLVVKQLDWIQSRFLFVQCQVPEELGPRKARNNPPTAIYPQDPKYTAIGPHRGPVAIPITAVSQRRRQLAEILDNDTKGKKRARPENLHSMRSPEYDTASVETEHEDLMVLLSDSDDDRARKTVKIRPNSSLVSKSATSRQMITTSHSGKNFKPGTLAGSSLPLLAPPSYATTSATKMLQSTLRVTLKIQDSHPLDELGWYVDPNLITTVYQWIVELHSFDPGLPLVADLEAAGLQSVVLELRFPENYPMSPPFVRIIRPRFLGFQEGGGGHVTMGGALCMELLTNSGWTAVSTIESVLLQVRMAISSTEPKPARLQRGQREGQVQQYGVGEAVSAYMRACQTHGWKVPPSFEKMSYLESAKNQDGWGL